MIGGEEQHAEPAVILGVLDERLVAARRVEQRVEQLLLHLGVRLDHALELAEQAASPVRFGIAQRAAQLLDTRVLRHDQIYRVHELTTFACSAVTECTEWRSGTPSSTGSSVPGIGDTATRCAPIKRQPYTPTTASRTNPLLASPSGRPYSRPTSVRSTVLSSHAVRSARPDPANNMIASTPAPACSMPTRCAAVSRGTFMRSNTPITDATTPNTTPERRLTYASRYQNSSPVTTNARIPARPLVNSTIGNSPRRAWRGWPPIVTFARIPRSSAGWVFVVCFLLCCCWFGWCWVVGVC